MPVWFLVQDGELLFNTGPDTAKGRALARDPRLVACVDSEVAPYGFVQVQGVVTLVRDPDELLRSATAISTRYVGPERGAEFGRRNGVPGGLLVRLRPTKVLAALDLGV